MKFGYMVALAGLMMCVGPFALIFAEYGWDGLIRALAVVWLLSSLFGLMAFRKPADALRVNVIYSLLIALAVVARWGLA